MGRYTPQRRAEREESMASRRDSFSGRPPARLRLLLTFATLVGLVLALAPLQIQVARAAGITVTTTTDVINATDGLCSLREAIIAADNNTASGLVAGECPAGQAGPTVDTITLTAGATYILTIPNPAPTTPETTPLSGDLDITDALTIQVAGGGTATIDANGTVTHDRAFEIASGVTVAITGVTIRNGQVSGTLGPTAGGGGILSQGILTLTASTVSGNSVVGAAFPSFGLGGGIAATGGALTLIASTVSGNSANEGG